MLWRYLGSHDQSCSKRQSWLGRSSEESQIYTLEPYSLYFFLKSSYFSLMQHNNIIRKKNIESWEPPVPCNIQTTDMFSNLSWNLLTTIGPLLEPSEDHLKHSPVMLTMELWTCVWLFIWAILQYTLEPYSLYLFLKSSYFSLMQHYKEGKHWGITSVMQHTPSSQTHTHHVHWLACYDVILVLMIIKHQANATL